MDRRKIRRFRQALEAKRRALEEKATRNARQARSAPRDGGGDSVDDAIENYNREFLFSLTALERRTLQEVEEALARIEEGSYGYCLLSGEPIAEARLRAIPWARYTVECQEELEREQRAERRGGKAGSGDSVAG
jgi:RNA polymerase-binding protein DksA